MKHLRWIAVLCWFMLLLRPLLFARGGNEEAKEGYEGMIETFFSYLSGDQPREAVDFVYSDVSWGENRAEEIRELREEFVGLVEELGQYHGYELLIREDMLNRFILLDYFVKYERQPISVIFELYKPQETWKLYSFSYSTDLDEMLREKALSKFFNEPGPPAEESDSLK